MREYVDKLRELFPSTNKEIFLALEHTRYDLLLACHSVSSSNQPIPVFAIPIEFYRTVAEAHAAGRELVKTGWKVRYIEMLGHDDINLN